MSLNYCLYLYGTENATNDESTETQSAVDTSSNLEDNSNLDEDNSTEPVICDSVQSAGSSVETSRDLGEKHVGPSQPRLAKYPSTKIGKQNRSFNQEWFEKFPWMEYSVVEDAVFLFSL